MPDKTSYFKISWSLEVVRFVFRIVRSLWNLAGTSAAVLSNFKAMRKFKLRISRLRDFTRSYDKTSYWILKRGPDLRVPDLQISLEHRLLGVRYMVCYITQMTVESAWFVLMARPLYDSRPSADTKMILVSQHIPGLPQHNDFHDRSIHIYLICSQCLKLSNFMYLTNLIFFSLFQRWMWTPKSISIPYLDLWIWKYHVLENEDGRMTLPVQPRHVLVTRRAVSLVSRPVGMCLSFPQGLCALGTAMERTVTNSLKSTKEKWRPRQLYQRNHSRSHWISLNRWWLGHRATLCTLPRTQWRHHPIAPLVCPSHRMIWTKWWPARKTTEKRPWKGRAKSSTLWAYRSPYPTAGLIFIKLQWNRVKRSAVEIILPVLATNSEILPWMCHWLLMRVHPLMLRKKGYPQWLPGNKTSCPMFPPQCEPSARSPSHAALSPSHGAPSRSQTARPPLFLAARSWSQAVPCPYLAVHSPSAFLNYTQSTQLRHCSSQGDMSQMKTPFTPTMSIDLLSEINRPTRLLMWNPSYDITSVRRRRMWTPPRPTRCTPLPRNLTRICLYHYPHHRPLSHPRKHPGHLNLLLQFHNNMERLYQWTYHIH